MKLQDLTITEFLEKTYGSDPVPGGGSVSALCGALASALAQMVAQLTVGKKKYADVQDDMQHIITVANDAREKFLDYITADADAYDKVFQAFKMPKDTPEQIAARADAIEKNTLYAAQIPLEVAELAVNLMPTIAEVAHKGNQNAITDACVAMMCARTATLGAILNVKINLSSLKDADAVLKLSRKCSYLEAEAVSRESELLQNIKL